MTVERHRGRRSIVLRRLIVTTVGQAGHAPVVDDCWGNGETRTDMPGWPRLPTWLAPEGTFRFTGKSVLLAPWRRDRYGERPPQRALVLGWITSRGPLP